MPEKADADDIRAFLTELQAETWLGRQRHAWPTYAYHYSDVRNAASILRGGRLLSRERCQEEGIDWIDAARGGIIARSPWAHRFVRLYLRPRTPTQYRCEGHRSVGNRWGDAHCPVPIFFLFDAAELYVDTGCTFVDGNLARGDHQTGTTAAFLRSLDFKDIYRDKALPNDPQRKDELTRAMNSEVLFEDELGLDHLSHVVCRTGAERDTLLNLLNDSADEWRHLIRLEEQGERLYFRRWAFLETVQLVERRLVVTAAGGRGDVFDIRLRARAPEGQTFDHTWRRQLETRFYAELPFQPTTALVRIDLDDAVAFRGVVSSRAIF